MQKKILSGLSLQILLAVCLLFGSSLFLTVSASMVPADAAPVNVTINYAWYGTENDWNKSGNTQQMADIVVNKLKEVTTKYGFIVIPGNMNNFYGFDPIPGTVKTTAIDATVNGIRKMDYRAPEGTDFVLPAFLAGTPQANAALAEIKAALPTTGPGSLPKPAPASKDKPNKQKKPSKAANPKKLVKPAMSAKP